MATNFGAEMQHARSNECEITRRCRHGKTTWRMRIMKELILSRGFACLFYDYRELLKEIQKLVTLPCGRRSSRYCRRVLKTML